MNFPQITSSSQNELIQVPQSKIIIDSIDMSISIYYIYTHTRNLTKTRPWKKNEPFGGRPSSPLKTGEATFSPSPKMPSSWSASGRCAKRPLKALEKLGSIYIYIPPDPGPVGCKKKHTKIKGWVLGIPQKKNTKIKMWKVVCVFFSEKMSTCTTFRNVEFQKTHC